jgi:hypothetical protein
MLWETRKLITMWSCLILYEYIEIWDYGSGWTNTWWDESDE